MPEREKKRVLLIYRDLTPSIRLCGHCQLELLAAEGALEYRAIQEMKLRICDMNWADVVVLGRLDSWYENKLAQMLRAAGKYIVYILDDDLLNIPPYVNSAAYYRQPEIQANIRGMIGLSDAILSPSPLLLEKYAREGRRAIQLEEPAIDPVAHRERDPDRPVKIGFAGSIDRVGDVEGILREALFSLKAAYGDRIELEFFGAVPSFAAELSARCIPYRDSYEQYRKTLNGCEWDIGLAPMPDTPFNACKHYNKFCEYAAAGIAGVYSNVYPYTRLSAFPGCGVLCDNSSEAWTTAIGALIDDRARLGALRAAALRCARRELTVKRCAEPLRQALCEVSTAHGEVGVRRVEWFALKLCNPFKRLATKYRSAGFKGCIRAIIKKAGNMKIRRK